MISTRLRIVYRILFALGAALAVTVLVIWLAGAPPLSTFSYLFKGSLGSWNKFAQVIKVWIPLTLCACGLIYTFRIGLWNIGVEGQVIMGAITCTAVLRAAPPSAPAGLVLAAALASSMLGGALWALLAGFLKTRTGVNEIFAGLGLNFVAQGLILWLIFGPWKRPGIASMSGTQPLPYKLWLPYIRSWRISPWGLGITIAAIVITIILMRFTRLGLCLKAIGSNARAAFLCGLRPGVWMLTAMCLAGGFAGLAGSIQVTGVYHRLIPAISSNYGYLALMVVMVSNYNIWLAPLMAFFFACLNVGSIQLPMMLHIDSSLSGIIQGVLVLVVMVVQAWQQPQNEIGHQPGGAQV